MPPAVPIGKAFNPDFGWWFIMEFGRFCLPSPSAWDIRGPQGIGFAFPKKVDAFAKRSKGRCS